MSTPAMSQPADAERRVISAARDSRQRCACGETHDDQDAVPPAAVARVRGYLTAHPGQQLAIDADGTLAVIALREPGPPQVLATSQSLEELLDTVGAPAPGTLS